MRDSYEDHLRQLEERNRPFHYDLDFDVDKPATKMSWWRQLKRWLMGGVV